VWTYRRQITINNYNHLSLTLIIMNMKQLMKILTLMTVALLFTYSAFGQASVSAATTASATIVTPLTITKTSDMNFGNLAVNATSGTLGLTAAATPTRTPAGGVSLMGGGTVAAATFTVSGLLNATYAITLPADGAVTLTGPGTAMALTGFVSTPTVVAGGNLGGTGSQTLYVGAVLNVAASQATGSYSSANFNVTVNYN
jgi:hypothetical protein